jgi:hypothetical protein
MDTRAARYQRAGAPVAASFSRSTQTWEFWGVIAGQTAARQQSAVARDDPTAQTTSNSPLAHAGTKKSPVPCFQDTGH